MVSPTVSRLSAQSIFRCGHNTCRATRYPQSVCQHPQSAQCARVSQHAALVYIFSYCLYTTSTILTTTTAIRGVSSQLRKQAVQADVAPPTLLAEIGPTDKPPNRRKHNVRYKNGQNERTPSPIYPYRYIGYITMLYIRHCTYTPTTHKRTQSYCPTSHQTRNTIRVLYIYYIYMRQSKSKGRRRPRRSRDALQ